MGREITEPLVDDLMAVRRWETVVFGSDGAGCQIDLNTKNAAVLHKTLER